MSILFLIAREARWQDWVALLMGVLLLVSPFVFTDAVQVVSWNACATGAAIVVIAVVALFRPDMWEEILLLVLGGWLAVSPWLLHFSTERYSLLCAVVTGVIIMACAVWAMRKEEFSQ